MRLGSTRPCLAAALPLLGGLLLAQIFGAGDASAAETRRISLSSNDREANGDSQKSSISGDGRYIAFSSVATNLVKGDTNGKFDVFVRDNDTGTTVRIMARNGAEANNSSYRPAISLDGRFVAFTSIATNFVEGDANGKADIFVHDLRTGKTERVSVDSGGAEADGASDYAAISGDGQRVVFQTLANNLYPDDENKLSEIIMRDRAAGVTTLVSKNADGTPAEGENVEPAISANGRFVTFWGGATGADRDYSPVRHDTETGDTVCVSVRANGSCIDSAPQLAPTSISADGRYVVFQEFVDGDTGTDETYIMGVVVRDMKTGDSRVVSRPASGDLAKYDSYRPAISADGRYIAYTSGASNIIPSGDTNKTRDVFVTDRVSGAVTRVSVGGKNTQASLYSDIPAISADGRLVTFTSQATELVEGDSNGAFDIFMRDLDAEPGKKADMRVDARQAPRKVRRGERTMFSFVATNAGPDPATKASFSVQVENGRVRDASSKQGDCAVLVGLVTCDLGKLGPRKSVMIKAEVVAEGGTLRQTVRVHASPVDPETKDNSLTLTSKAD